MTDDTSVDELLLTAAKLGEQARGDLDPGLDLHDHAGAVLDDGHRSALSFLDGLDEWHDSPLRQVVQPTVATAEATRAVSDERASQLSNLVGVTEQDLTADEIRLPFRLLNEMDNHGAPAFVLGCGLPETGKTTLVALLAELRLLDKDDLIVVSNVRGWDLTDEYVASCHDLATTLLRLRDVPKFVFIDEGSTVFDARSNRYEVGTQWGPLAKRFAKIDVDVCATVGHTGKDVHPEYKRLTTLAFWKTQPEEAEFYGTWASEDESPSDRLFGGRLVDLEHAASAPDPDDSAPWAWDLPESVFEEDMNWSELLDHLRAVGPDTE
jgi:hypothetical protein